MALDKLKAWRAINEEAPVKPDFYDDAALDAACKEWLLETFEEEEVTGGALQHGSASMITVTISNGSTTKRRTRRADVPAVSGENGFGGARENEQSV